MDQNIHWEKIWAGLNHFFWGFGLSEYGNTFIIIWLTKVHFFSKKRESQKVSQPDPVFYVSYVYILNFIIIIVVCFRHFSRKVWQK